MDTYEYPIHEAHFTVSLPKTTHELLNKFLDEHPDFEFSDSQSRGRVVAYNSFILRSIDLWSEGYVEAHKSKSEPKSEPVDNTGSTFICVHNGTPTTILFCHAGHVYYCSEPNEHSCHTKCFSCGSTILHWSNRRMDICGVTNSLKSKICGSAPHSENQDHRFYEPLDIYPVLAWK